MSLTEAEKCLTEPKARKKNEAAANKRVKEETKEW